MQDLPLCCATRGPGEKGEGTKNMSMGGWESGSGLLDSVSRGCTRLAYPTPPSVPHFGLRELHSHQV